MQQHVNTLAMAPSFSAHLTPGSNSTSKEGQHIRLLAAELFSQGRLAEADLLTFEAMQQNSDSEDVLVIRALICEVRHDWTGAATALERLIHMQGSCAPVETWCHWVRVLRADGLLEKARQEVLKGLQIHTAHPMLASELAQLEAIAAQTDAEAN